MRMWMVDPKGMCNQHLLGEHVELHMLVGTLKKGISVAGYIKGGLMESHNILSRHAELVTEMEGRGMNHKSPLGWMELTPEGYVDREANLVEMARRCPRCAARQRSSKKELQLLELAV